MHAERQRRLLVQRAGALQHQRHLVRGDRGSGHLAQHDRGGGVVRGAGDTGRHGPGQLGTVPSLAQQQGGRAAEVVLQLGPGALVGRRRPEPPGQLIEQPVAVAGGGLLDRGPEARQAAAHERLEPLPDPGGPVLVGHLHQPLAQCPHRRHLPELAGEQDKAREVAGIPGAQVLLLSQGVGEQLARGQHGPEAHAGLGQVVPGRRLERGDSGQRVAVGAAREGERRVWVEQLGQPGHRVAQARVQVRPCVGCSNGRVDQQHGLLRQGRKARC